MKKINLNQLSMSWNERKRPQRFARYAAMLIMLLTLGVGQMWGDVRVYVTASIFSGAWDSNTSTVKIVYNSSEGWSNGAQAMTKTAYTYKGFPIYYYDIHTSSGIAVKYYHFKNNVEQSEYTTGLDSWYSSGSDYNNKLYCGWNSSSHVWTGLAVDGTIYWANTEDIAGTPKAHGWGDGSTEWPGSEMLNTGKTYNGHAIYSVTFNNPPYYNLCLNINGDSYKTGELIVGTENVGKMYLGKDGGWIAYNYDVTVSFNMGGHGSAVSSQTILKGTTASEPSTPVDGDWTFEGWYEESTFENKWNFSSTINSDKVLYAHWTQEPIVTNLSASAGDIYSGEGSITLTATRNTAASSLNIQYQVKVPGGSWTNIGDAVNSTTKTYSPTNGDGTYEFRAYPVDYSSNSASTDKRVYEHWTIYVRDDVDNWGTMKLYLYDNSTSAHKTDWPGDACSNYKSSAKWYTVTLDSKYPHFILNNNNANKQLLGDGSIATDKSTYTPGSYWKTVWNSDGTGGDSEKKFYTLTSATITDPVVTITRCDVYSTYALLEGNVTGFGDDGSALSDLMEYGFYIGETKNTTIRSTSGNYFRVKVTGLTPGSTYNIKAFATNIENTANSAVQNKTASNESRTIGVRYPDATDQTLKLYAYRDIPTEYRDDSETAETVKNADWSGATLTRRSGTSRWWETTVTNAADYAYFIVSKNGSYQAADQTMPATDKCYWYNPDGDPNKIGEMDCPNTAPQLYINATAGATDYAYNEMSTSPSISKTMSLSAGTYTFKIVYNAEYYGKNSDNTISRTGATSSNAISSLTIDQDYITLTADFAGDYIFTFDPSSSNTVSVTYPTAYTVTYSAIRIGNGTAWDTDPSATYTKGGASITSTHYVPVETDVTFTADDANEGYTWKGWYDGPTLSYTQLSTNDDLTYALEDIGANTTVYAIYQEDMHTVTVNVVNGTITTPAGGAGSTVSAGIATGAPIAASANYGYVFSGWSVESGSATFVDASNPSTTVKATSDATIQANFFPHWSVAGSKTATSSGDADDPMGDWDLYTNGIDNFTQDPVSEKWSGWVDIDLPANTTFYFKIRDLNNTKWYSANSEMTYSNHTDWKMYDNVSENCRITTAGKGTYKFTWNETDEKLTVTYPTSYTVTYNVSTFYNEDASYDYDNTTGGSITYAKDNDSITLTSGKYVVNGGTMTFKATPASGYTFAGWYKNQACSSEYTDGSDGAAITDGTLTLTVGANKTVYAKFSENMCTVTINANKSSLGSITVGGDDFTWGGTTNVGVTTTKDLVVTPMTGYYFAGWTLTADGDPDFSVGNEGEVGASTTLSGIGGTNGSTGTLTAKFVELEKVYFRNWNADSSEPLWTNVYVYFTTGESEGCPVANVSGSYKALMTQEGTSNNYWAYVPRGVTKNTEGNIAFSNTNFGTGETFGSGEGVMRADYRAGLSMFVPRHSSTESKCSMTFYKGYWKHHNLEPGTISGYSIERYTGGSSYEPAADNGGDKVNFIVLNEDKIQYSLRVDNTGDGHNNYRINSKGGIHYITYNESPAESGYTIDYSNYKDIHMSEYLSGSPRFYITPTTQNLYTLTIDQSGDEMLLTVDYPVAKDDYRIVHTYSSGGTKKAYSDIIKSSEAGSGVTASMYINTSSSPTLTLEKCTAISPKVTWTQQGGDLWESYGSNFNKGNGVYQFDVTINTSTNAITTIENSGIYKGEFYIKTDCAPGGWTAWKANVMEKNTITFDKNNANTFDRSFCHWIDQVRGSAKPMNVKCVIANDYNIAVSDTLVGDDILGTYDEGGKEKPYENIPAAAHVRFSYNSTTNELKRTYLAVVGTDHLVMEGNTYTDDKSVVHYMIHDSENNVFTDNKATLGNQSNFTFMLDIKAREKARVRLSAKYNGTIQDLIGDVVTTYGSDLTNGNTVEIIGGDIAHTDYNDLRISYDFKTNQLLSAWLAPTSSNSPNKAINADVMILREGQGDARQITFATSSDILSAVDTVYGVMKFNKWVLNNKSLIDHEADSTLSVYARGLYWISFPFNVRLSDAFGMGTYGTHWIIEYYDGKERAQNGFWADSEGFWKYVTPYQRDNGFILKANEGYVLALDLDELDDESLVWDNGMTEAYLYFPSSASIGNIQKVDEVEVPINQDGYQCTIGPRFEGGDDRRVKDSYWHIIGVPSYANTALTTSSSEPEDLGEGTTEPWAPDYTLYFYDWNSETNTYTINSSSSYTFKPMHSYMVQYGCTTLTWTRITNSNVPARIAARVAETTDYNIKLSLLRDDEEQDRTLLRMTNDVNATNRFEFNYDICKEYNGGRANIWTVTADTVEVAGNCLPTSTQTTVIPVGVKVVANGDYTFSIPDGTSGVNVTLVDTYTGTRTSLGLIDYTTYLTTGTHEGRFMLEIAPISQMPTDLENGANANANANADAVRKVFVGGQLYIIRDGVIYNASGARVQ